MYEFERQLLIRKFIFDKIKEGYSVRKLGEDVYEFKIKTKKLDSVEKIHSSNFLTDFLKKPLVILYNKPLTIWAITKPE
jgi:hypothetical protein